jgi:hypothetical protein
MYHFMKMVDSIPHIDKCSNATDLLCDCDNDLFIQLVLCPTLFAASQPSLDVTSAWMYLLRAIKKPNM